jgi:hypothetical protein
MRQSLSAIFIQGSGIDDCRALVFFPLHVLYVLRGTCLLFFSLEEVFLFAIQGIVFRFPPNLCWHLEFSLP